MPWLLRTSFSIKIFADEGGICCVYSNCVVYLRLKKSDQHFVYISGRKFHVRGYMHVCTWGELCSAYVLNFILCKKEPLQHESYDMLVVILTTMSFHQQTMQVQDVHFAGGGRTCAFKTRLQTEAAEQRTTQKLTLHCSGTKQGQ